MAPPYQIVNTRMTNSDEQGLDATGTRVPTSIIGRAPDAYQALGTVFNVLPFILFFELLINILRLTL